MTPRLRSIVSVVMLALAWVWTASLLADPQAVGQAHQAQPDVFATLLSGSGNSAILAVFLWMKLTSQDKEIAEMKLLLKSRPCVLDEPEKCETHGHERRGGKR